MKQDKRYKKKENKLLGKIDTKITLAEKEKFVKVCEVLDISQSEAIRQALRNSNFI